jgi:hypothetical protein
MSSATDEARVLYKACSDCEPQHNQYIASLSTSAFALFDSNVIGTNGVALSQSYAALLIAHPRYAATKHVDQKIWQLYYRIISLCRTGLDGPHSLVASGVLQVCSVRLIC